MVRRLPDGKELVAKVYSDEASFKDAIYEAEVLKQFDSPYIVRYYDSFPRKADGEDTYVIVTENGNLGDLKSLIEEHGGRRENLKLYLRIAMCILKGIEELHSKHKFHRDIKHENIFISGDFSDTSTIIAKLGDFGIMRDMKHAQVTVITAGAGSLDFMAPEMMSQKGGGLPSDMWAFGVTLQFLLTQRTPFPLVEDLLKGNARPLPGWVPSGVKKLVAGLLTLDPSQRINYR